MAITARYLVLIIRTTQAGPATTLVADSLRQCTEQSGQCSSFCHTPTLLHFTRRNGLEDGKNDPSVSPTVRKGQGRDEMIVLVTFSRNTTVLLYL